MNETDEIQRLIRLKRYESPGSDFYADFAERLKDRQRSEILQRSARSLLLERFSMWFDEIDGRRRVVPAAAMAAVALGVLLWAVPRTSDEPMMAEVGAGTNHSTPAAGTGIESFEVSVPQVSEQFSSDPPPAAEKDMRISVVPAGAINYRPGFREL